MIHVEDSAPKIILVGGANGSGKTTLAAQIAASRGLPFVNADETARALNPTDVHKARFQAGRSVLSELERLRETRASFVYESTLAGLSLRGVLQQFKENGYEISLVYVYLDSPKICIERIKSRVLRGGHSIPDDEVRRRYWRSLKLFWHEYRIIADDWYLFRNPDASLFQEIAIGDRHGITTIEHTFFDIFLEMVRL